MLRLMNNNRTNVSEENLLNGYSRRKLHSLSQTYGELARLYRDEPNDINNLNEGSDRRDILYRRQISDTKRAFAGQLEDISYAFADVADSVVMLNKPLEHRKKALIQYLRRQGISVREIVFMEGDEKNISIEARVNGRTSISAQALGELLSSFMGRKLVLSAESARLIGRTYDIYIYGDESKYMILSAVSRAVKENEKISGDNFSIEEYNHGQTVVMLADGMGSGEKACGDSRTLIEFMEKFLEAGFDRGRAFSMASAAISALEGSFGLTTLDMCTLDLMAGEADFIKAGAAPSYIKRGRGVNRIDSDTLPLGGTRSVTPILQTVRLFEDDMVVMVSDGIVEAVEGDGIMTVEEFLSRSDACIPNELSDKLLHYAISCQKGHIPDDMTVVVCRIKKKP